MSDIGSSFSPELSHHPGEFSPKENVGANLPAFNFGMIRLDEELTHLVDLLRLKSYGPTFRSHRFTRDES